MWGGGQLNLEVRDKAGGLSDGSEKGADEAGDSEVSWDPDHLSGGEGVRERSSTPQFEQSRPRGDERDGHPTHRAGQPRGSLGTVGEAWALLDPVPYDYQPVREILEPSVSMVAEGEGSPAHLSQVGTPSATDDRNAWNEFNNVNEFDEVLQAAVMCPDEDTDPRDFKIDMNESLDRLTRYGRDFYLPDGRDYYRKGRGHVAIFHVEPRKHFFDPYPWFGHENRLDVRDFSGERITVCKYFGPPPYEGVFYDNWHNNGNADPELGWWIGHTLLGLRGFQLPTMDDEGNWPESEHEEGEEESFQNDDEEVSTSTTRRSTSYGSSRSRSERRAGGAPAGDIREAAQSYVEVIQKLDGGTCVRLEAGA